MKTLYMSREERISLDSKRSRKSLSHKQKAKLLRQLESGFSPSKKVKIPRVIVDAPEYMCIYTQHTHYLMSKFLRQIRKTVFKHRRDIIIDFSKTIQCRAAGTLLLLAEIDRIQRIRKTKNVVKATLPSNDKVAQVFQQVGLFEILGIHKTVNVTDDDVVFWGFVSDTKVEGQRAESFFEKFNSELMKLANQQGTIYNGFIEAIENTRQHAYDKSRGDGATMDETRWWMFAGIHDSKLAMVVCDLGMGIPRSVPIKTSKELVNTTLQKLRIKSSDAGMIHDSCFNGNKAL